MTALVLKVPKLFFSSFHCCLSVPWAHLPAQVLEGAQPLSQLGWGPTSQEGRGCCGWSRNGNGRVAGSRPRALTRGRSLPHSQRKQARELLAALQKVVVPIYCTSFLAVEEDKQQKIARVCGAAGRGGGRGGGREGQGGGDTGFPGDAASPSSPASSSCSSGRRMAILTTPSSSSYRARPWGSASTRWVPSPPTRRSGWTCPEGVVAATAARSQKSCGPQLPPGELAISKAR